MAYEADLVASRGTFFTVLRNSVKNVTFFGGTPLIIILLAGAYVRWLGLTLFVGFLIMAALNIVQWLIVAGLSVLVGPLKVIEAIKQREPNLVKDEAYLLAGTFIQLLENGCYVVIASYLYIRLFPEGI